MSVTIKHLKSAAFIMPVVLFLAACTATQGSEANISMAGKPCCCGKMAEHGACCPMMASSGEKKGCCCDQHGSSKGMMCKPVKE